MRAALVLAVLVLAGTTQAFAQPPAIVLPEPLTVGRGASHPTLSDPNTFQEITQTNAAREMAQRAQTAASAPHALSLGPFSMDVDNADFVGRDGKRARFAHIQLDGVHVLGGHISGNFTGRSATIHLSWPTGE
jgi:hypothetical protein